MPNHLFTQGTHHPADSSLTCRSILYESSIVCRASDPANPWAQDRISTPHDVKRDMIGPHTVQANGTSVTNSCLFAALRIELNRIVESLKKDKAASRI